MSWSVPPNWMCLLLALWLFQAGWSFYNVRRFLRRVRTLMPRGRKLRGERQVSALLIVPVKGDASGGGGGGDLAEHADLLLRQFYTSSYRVVFSVERADDPAVAVLEAAIAAAPIAQHAKGRRCIEAKVVVAGLAERGGQKVHNQLRALDEHRDERVVVFADADAAPGKHWLSGMAYGALKSRYPASTGYRWMVPADGSLASRFASVINASIATMLGPDHRNHAWGGSMAVDTQKVPLDTLRRSWAGALSDDYQFSRAVREAGERIYFVPQAMTASPIRYTWRSAFAFARRQYLITRLYAPWTFLAALLIPAIYLAGLLTAIVAASLGSAWGLIAIGVVFTLDVMRGLSRRRIARELFDSATTDRLRGAFALDAFATPIWMAVHLAAVLSAVVGRRLKWAGVTYDMRGRQDVRILARDAAAPPR